MLVRSHFNRTFKSKQLPLVVAVTVHLIGYDSLVAGTLRRSVTSETALNYSEPLNH